MLRRAGQPRRTDRRPLQPRNVECRLQARVDSRLLARQQVHRLLRYRIETGLLHPDTRPRATRSRHARSMRPPDTSTSATTLCSGCRRGCCTWAAGSALTLKYKGKRHELPYPMCFSVGQVNANAYPLTARFTRTALELHSHADRDQQQGIPAAARHAIHHRRGRGRVGKPGCLDLPRHDRAGVERCHVSKALRF